MVFFFNDTATTEIYTLSLHDALPIYRRDAHGARVLRGPRGRGGAAREHRARRVRRDRHPDRKSTRLNSSHANISYAVFCLKKKKILHLHCVHYILRHPALPVSVSPPL